MKVRNAFVSLALLATLGIGAAEAARSLKVPADWPQSFGSYAKVSKEGESRGLLMLKPLDEGCVLFDLSATELQGDDSPAPSYRVAGIFFLDDTEKGVWEDRATGQTLTFSKYRQRITVQPSPELPSVLGGAYTLCSAKVNATQPMLEVFLDYLPQFKTLLSHKKNYQVSDISEVQNSYRQLLFSSSDGQSLLFWSTPNLDQVIRVDGQRGVVIYQAPEVASEQPR